MTQQYGSAPQPPAPAYGGAPMEDPGKTLGILALVFAFVFSPVGIVLGAIGGKKSKEAGFDNQLAKWGLILGIVFTALWIIYVVFVMVAAFAAISSGVAVSSY